mgnify:CR=1 FL=1
MIADRLRAAILQAAISGKLTDQRPEDGTATELLETIKTERQQLEEEGKIKKQKPLPPVDKTDEPFDLPDSWVWSRLGRVFNMQAGKNVAVGNISEVGEYPCYGGNGIRGYVADYNRDGTYPIIGRQGALCGNINVASGRFFATEHAVVVETFGHTSPAWAALALEQLNLNQYATATAQPGLSVEKLKVVPVPVPPVDEQERIVAKLDEVLPLIDQLAELESDREYLDRKFAKAIERAILQAAISGKLTKQLPEDGTAAELLETIKTERHQLEKEGKIKKRKPLPPVDTSELPFGIPEKWQWVRLGELFSVKSGKATSLEEQSVLHPVPVYGGNGIAGFTSRATVPNGTLVIGRVGFYCGCVHITQSDAWISDNALEVTAHSQSIPLWYWQYVLTYLNLGQTSVSTAQPVVSGKRMYPVAVPVPPVLEQVRIVGKLNKLLPLARGIGELVS